MKLAALACGGWPRGFARGFGLWRAQGLDGLRRGLAVLAAHTELTPEEGGFAPGDYAEWVRRYDTPDARATARLRRRAASPELAGAPLIRLALLPGDWDFLDRTLDSLRAQVYARWELVAGAAGVADEAEVEKAHATARAAFERRAGRAVNDPRIRFAPPGLDLAGALAGLASKCEPGGKSGCADSAVFTGFLRAGDELPPHGWRKRLFSHRIPCPSCCRGIWCRT